MILTSSRAVPGAPVDAFSDYDVILVLDDIRPYHEDAGWMGAFGSVLANYRFQEELESFFLDTRYVAKCLRRGEFFAGRHVLENHLKQEHLFKTLEWLGQIEHDWRLKTGPHGRRMETWLRPDLREKLAATYTSVDPNASREAFTRTFDLFCTVMAEAAGKLGLEYARGTEQRVRAQIVKLLG